MKIAIIGYGRMGKEIEKQANTMSIDVSKRIDTAEELQNAKFSANEVAIEFTEPKVCTTNIKTLADKKVPIICGTTGWFNEIQKIENIVKKKQIGFLYSTNFSIGVNIFWLIVEHSAKLINNFKQYDIMGNEIHHKNKLDSPSGTAITTAKILLKHLERKNSVVTDKIQKGIKNDELHFSSTRGGYTIGEHSVTFDSPHDTIKISHLAKNREGFAIGAIECAKWLYKNSRTGFFTINDYLEDILNG